MRINQYTYKIRSRRETIDGSTLSVLAKSQREADLQVLGLADVMEIASAEIKSVRPTKHQPRITK